MKRLSPVGAAVLVLAALVQPAVGAQPTPASGETWAPDQRVQYRWKAGAEPPSWARAAMNAAAADSNSSQKSKAALFSHSADGTSWLAYTDDLPTNWAIGYTVRNIPHSFSIRMRPHGTQLDWGTLKWCEFYDDPPNGCYDLEMVTLHEFGHAQTLGHVDESQIDSYTDSLMHATGLRSRSRTGWDQHEYGRCDVARLQIRYEPQTTSTRLSTCLNLATQLEISPGSGAYASGTAVTLTARLKIAADEVYPNLAGRALAGRTVVLQRRAPTETGWTSVGEMAAVTDDGGRYVRTVTLNATYDWRASFTAPDDEGLRSSTSGLARLSVAPSGCAPTGEPVSSTQADTC